MDMSTPAMADLPFGPCESDMRQDESRSFFCQGAGVATIDPYDVFGLGQVILCGPCVSFREGKVIEVNLLSILDSIKGRNAA